MTIDGRNDPPGPVLGLQADPGVPARLAARIAEDLAAQLSRATDRPWRVDVSAGELPLGPDGRIPLLASAPRLLEEHGWEYVVYLTDLPRYLEGRPLLSEVSADAHAALISLPSLGALRVAGRTRSLVVELIDAASAARSPDAAAIESALGGAAVHQELAEEESLTLTARADRLTAPRMLAGMLRSNRPGRLLPAMTGCIAVAVASGAFGIFYGTLATVADPLSIPRLLLISVLVITVLTLWLIIANRLWNRQEHPEQLWRRRLDNTSTLVTVGVSVLLMYVILVAVMLVLSLAMIDESFLRSEVMHPVGFGDYLRLAWLSASMGTLAGALGSNFDSVDAVREATYSRRYHQRRELFETYQEERSGA